MAVPITPAPMTATSQSGIISASTCLSSHAAGVLPRKDNQGRKGTISRTRGAKKALILPLFATAGWVRGLLLLGARSLPMEINRAAFGALAVFGVVAAGGGAYLANRHNDAAMQAVPLYPAPAVSAVTETENSIATPAVAVEPAPFVAAEPAPAPARPAPVARRAPTRETRPTTQRPRTASNTRGTEPTSAPTYTPPAAPVDPPVAAAIEPLENTAVERTAVVQEPARKQY